MAELTEYWKYGWSNLNCAVSWETA